MSDVREFKRPAKFEDSDEILKGEEERAEYQRAYSAVIASMGFDATPPTEISCRAVLMGGEKEWQKAMSDAREAAEARGRAAYEAAVAKPSPAEWLRDHLSKYGAEMDTPEYDGLAMCLRALDESAKERASCLDVAVDCLVRGPAFPASKDFADGYSLAAQEIAAGIRKPE